MNENIKVLCDIGEQPCFISGGTEKIVDINEIDKKDNLNQIYRFQFSQPPTDQTLERVVTAILNRPEISLRFYGNYSENEINWQALKGIQNLQMDLWVTHHLEQVSTLTSLKSLGITKNVKSKVSLSILEPLHNLETLYTNISKGVETISRLSKLKFLSLYGVKSENIDFLTNLDHLKTLWISFGSIKDLSGLQRIKNLERLWLLQVRGVNSAHLNPILKNCIHIWALKLENLKHITNLDFIEYMPSIRYLSLRGIRNLDTFAPIKRSSTLETVDGYMCRPADKSLGGLSDLREVWLGDSYTKPEIESFLKVTDAENIWIRGKLKGDGENEDPFE